MKSFKIFFACLVLFILERVVFTRFQIFSLTPWLVFSFCLIAGSVTRETNSAIVTALIYGLISDLIGTGVVGGAMFSFALAVFVVQFMVGKIFKNSLPVSIISVFFASVLGELVYYLFNIQGIDISFGRLLWSFVLPLSVMNTITALLLYYPAKWIFAERRAK